MSFLSRLMGAPSRRKQAAAQAEADAKTQKQVADQQGQQLAALSDQQASLDRQIGRAGRATRGRQLLRYAQGAAGQV